jgi:Histidine kinase-, DNA gyrase B-, and HSP90-like ATPase
LLLIAANETQIAEVLAALAQHLSARREALLEAWRQSVDGDPHLTTASTLSKSQFIDLIPRLLDAFEQRLTAESYPEKREAVAGQTESAAAHGLQRWQQVCIVDSGPGITRTSTAPSAHALEQATREAHPLDGDAHRAASDQAVAPRSQPAPRVAHGEGIGLAIVKRLCQLLKATLELESHDTGTTFRVPLPRAYS